MSNRNEDWKNSNFKATFSNKNAEQEEIGSLRASREKENYYNLNVATFTFGGRQNNHINSLINDNNLENLNSNNYKKQNTNIKNNPSRSKDKERENEEYEHDQNFVTKQQNQIPSKYINDNLPGTFNNSIVSNNTQQTNNSHDISQITTVHHINNTSSVSNVGPNNIPSNQTLLPYGPALLNRIGDHNSFLSVVIHALWNIKFMRNFIINDLNTLNEKESKNKLFYHLKSLFLKYERNKVLDINKLRVALAETFQNRRKFLLDQPDDPVDCYFAFINAIHSHHIQTSLGEIKDTNCYNKCLAHKYLWIDLCRVDGCECQGTSKRLFSYHNYIFDIPLEKIFNLTTNVNLIEMTKSFKIKSLHVKNQLGNELNQISSVNNLSDLKGKLFLYYKLLFNQLKTDCPEKGASCEINKTNRAFFLTNIPYNLSFGLVNPKKYGKMLTHMEILKSFILIPKILDLSVLFDYSSKQKVFYEFFGGFLIKPSKAYSCFFRQQSGNQNDNFSWVYYDCGKITSNSSEQNYTLSFNNWFDLISHCLANGEYPIMLFYQIQQKYIDNERDISNEEIQTLERYAKSADNLNSIVMYKFRPTEDIIRSEPSSNSNSLHLNNNAIQSGSKGSSNISSSRNTSNNNSQSRMETGDYNCIYCFSKNRMDNMLCYKCGQNNEAVIEEIIKKRHLNNNFINIANFNLNINTDEKMSFRTNENQIDKNNNNAQNQVKKIKNNDYSDNNVVDDNSNYDHHRDPRTETDRESVKYASLNKKHAESIQPQIQNKNSKNPFELADNSKKSRERTPTNINTINHDEDLKMKHLNMPKQISNKNASTNKPIQSSISRDTHHSNERPSQIPTNKEYLNSPPNHQMNRSNSKRNLHYNSQNNNNNNAAMFIPENLKIKKMETITTSSYVSTPVFNKEKEREKTNEKEKNRAIEDRFKPFEDRDKKKINTLNTPNNTNQGISIERKSNNITNPKNNHDHWICEGCSFVNKNNNHKCTECKRSYNSSIRDSFKNESSHLLSDNNFKETDSFSTHNIQETFGNKNSKNNPPSYVNQVQINLNNVNNKKYQSLEKKNVQSIITSPSTEKKMINNYFSEKSESKNRNNCPCQSHFEESLVRNNHCKLCGRYIEIHIPQSNHNSNQNHQITYLDNILKKKGFENDYSSNQSKTNILKKPSEKEKPVMIHENNKKREFDKMKSPTSNNVKPRITQGPLTNNKHEDERMNNIPNNNFNNPFNKQMSKDRESKEKELSRQIRMNSTNKRKQLELNKLKK